MAKGKAPGKSFRKGITLVDAIKRFDTEEKAEAWFVAQRWPDGVRCAHCSSDRISVIENRKPQPYRCKDCRKHFSVKTDSLLHSSNLPLTQWAIAFYLFNTSLKGVASMKLHRDLGITQKSAWYMGQRIRGMWNPVAERFAGPVEADETYIGGREGNKHETNKLHAGRGAVGKTPVAGLIDRTTNQIKTQVVASVDGKTLKGFVHMETEVTAQLYTDEAKAYEGLNRAHEAVAHSAHEYVRGMAHTNGMESHWALMKRGIDGIYHHVSKKHLGRYTNEFAGRHNNRPKDTETQMEGLVQGAAGKRITYETLIGPVSSRLTNGV